MNLADYVGRVREETDWVRPELLTRLAATLGARGARGAADHVALVLVPGLGAAG